MKGRIIKDIKINKSTVGKNNYNNGIIDINNKISGKKFGNHNHKVSEKIDESINNTDNFSNIKKRRGGKSKILYIFSFVVMLLFVLNYFFASAKIEINPKKEIIELENEIFTVSKVIDEGKESPGEFYYNIEEGEKVEKKVELKIAADKEIEEYASGKIEIKNDLDKKMQLIKTTRFEFNGKIYRIQNTVNIPKKSSKVVVVVADKAGEDYNNNKVGEKYSIPGLKEGSKEYKLVYGISKTKITGGFKGVKPVAEKKDLVEKKAKLTKEIKEEFRKGIREKSSKSEEIYFKSIARESIDFETVLEGDKLYLIANGVYVIPYIKRDNFDNVIINKVIKGNLVDGYLENRRKFEYGFIDASSADYKSGDSFKIRMSGKGVAIWNIDEDQMLRKLKGKSKDNLEKDIKKEFKVEDVNISVFPFWKNSLPDNIKKIDIKITD